MVFLREMTCLLEAPKWWAHWVIPMDKWVLSDPYKILNVNEESTFKIGLFHTRFQCLDYLKY